MKILSITAQKPHSTGSGVYLSELMKAFGENGVEQGVVAGIYEGDEVEFPEGTRFYPVYFQKEIPFPIVGMSDEMPYESTKYRDMDAEKTLLFQEGFRKRVKEAVEDLRRDFILCHHLYFLTALVRSWFPKEKVMGVCHNTDLLQLNQTNFQRKFIQKEIPKLSHIFALQQEQKEKIQTEFSVSEETITLVGAGFNHHIFYPNPNKKEKEKTYLVFAGKISKQKGLKSLMKSFAYLSKKKNNLEAFFGRRSRESRGISRDFRREQEGRISSSFPWKIVSASIGRDISKK